MQVTHGLDFEKAFRVSPLLLHSAAAKLSQHGLVVITDEPFGVLRLECVLIQPDSDPAALRFAYDTVRMNEIPGELAIFVEDIRRYQALNLVESDNHNSSLQLFTGRRASAREPADAPQMEDHSTINGGSLYHSRRRSTNAMLESAAEHSDLPLETRTLNGNRNSLRVAF